VEPGANHVVLLVQSWTSASPMTPLEGLDLARLIHAAEQMVEGAERLLSRSLSARDARRERRDARLSHKRLKGL
jgi:hypothetical protein